MLPILVEMSLIIITICFAGLCFHLEQSCLPDSSWAHFYKWQIFEATHSFMHTAENPRHLLRCKVLNLHVSCLSPHLLLSHSWPVFHFLWLFLLRITIWCLCMDDLCISLPWTLVRSWPGTWLSDFISSSSICPKEL